MRFPSSSKSSPRHGGHIDEDGRLRYPRAVVEKAIDMAAKSWVWHGFDEDKSIELADSQGPFRDRRRCCIGA